MKIIHGYTSKNIHHLEKNYAANCETCALSESTNTLEGDKAVLCKASLWDEKTLACYIPKQNMGKDESDG